MMNLFLVFARILATIAKYPGLEGGFLPSAPDPKEAFMAHLLSHIHMKDILWNVDLSRCESISSKAR